MTAYSHRALASLRAIPGGLVIFWYPSRCSCQCNTLQSNRNS